VCGAVHLQCDSYRRYVRYEAARVLSVQHHKSVILASHRIAYRPLTRLIAQGYSWATVVELLSTAFQSGPFGPAISGVDRATGKPAPMSLGNYFLAIDIEALCDLEAFKHNAGELLRFIRASQKDPRGTHFTCRRSTCS
jgi:LDH2 family malate/lactate/ureidoglycolate dehydrogenase